MKIVCRQCRSLTTKATWAENDVVRLARRVAAQPENGHLGRLLERAQDHAEEQQRRLDEHETRCEVEPAERPIWGVRAKAAPKPKKAPKVVEIDREAMASVLAVKAEPRVEVRGSNTLPATGRCHTCDRQISGERRFCGRCAARRTR